MCSDEKLDPVFKEKAVSFTCFESFMRYKINLGTVGIMPPSCDYYVLSKIYSESFSVCG